MHQDARVDVESGGPMSELQTSKRIDLRSINIEQIDLTLEETEQLLKILTTLITKLKRLLMTGYS